MDTHDRDSHDHYYDQEQMATKGATNVVHHYNTTAAVAAACTYEGWQKRTAKKSDRQVLCRNQTPMECLQTSDTSLSEAN